MNCDVCGQSWYPDGEDHAHCTHKGCGKEIQITCVDADWDSEIGYHSPDIRALPGEYRPCASCEEWFCAEHMTRKVCVDCASDDTVCLDCGECGNVTLGRCMKCAVAFPAENLRGAA